MPDGCVTPFPGEAAAPLKWIDGPAIPLTTKTIPQAPHSLRPHRDRTPREHGLRPFMTTPSPILKRILEIDCCTGCGICAAISGGAVGMELSDDKFLRPVQHGEVSDETERRIADICPGITLTQAASEGTDHPLWGPILDVRTGATTDDELRHHASSGGVISGLLVHLLSAGTVDRVIQIAAAEGAPIENAVVESVRRVDIYRAAGSRYAPSSPLQDLEHHLSRPGRFALVGKPCDVAAVRALGRHDPRIEEKIPVLISFFCAGVPSLKGTEQILHNLDVQPKDVVKFQYRGDGWPGHARAETVDGKSASMSYAQSWGRILSNHVQFRCKICPDGTGGFADIVCGDAWHCDADGYPLFEEEDGRSLVVTRTGIGEDILRGALETGHVTVTPLDAGEIEAMQPGQARRKKLVFSRLLAMALLGRRAPRFRGLQLLKAASQGGVWGNLRSFLGTVRRLILSRA